MSGDAASLKKTIFLAAMPGQCLFGVTPMTMPAVVTTFVFSAIYYAASGRFFFSSTRRHTTWPRDLSSDVCSSDLRDLGPAAALLRLRGGGDAGAGRDL